MQIHTIGTNNHEEQMQWAKRIIKDDLLRSYSHGDLRNAMCINYTCTGSHNVSFGNRYVLASTQPSKIHLQIEHGTSRYEIIKGLQCIIEGLERLNWIDEIIHAEIDLIRDALELTYKRSDS